MFLKDKAKDFNVLLYNALKGACNINLLKKATTANIPEISDLFAKMHRVQLKVFCEEWALQSDWLTKVSFFNHDESDHCHDNANPFGTRLKKHGEQEYVFGWHIHIEDKIIGSYDYNQLISEIAVLSADNMDLVAKIHSDLAWEKTVEAIMNKENFEIERNVIVNSQDSTILTNEKEASTAKDITTAAEKEAAGYNPSRLNKYDKPVAASTLKDISSAFGESLDEVLNRRDVRPLDKAVKEFFGVNYSDLSVGDKKYPSFYIPLALMGVEAVLANDYTVVQTINFGGWDDKVKPVDYRLFEMDYGIEKRILSDALRFCKRNSDGVKMIVQTSVRAGMSGEFLIINCMTLNADIDAYKNFMEAVKVWTKNNNYYKNKKIDAGGNFLNVAKKYSWKDAVYDTDIKDGIFMDVVGFSNNENLYKANNLPFKRGLILYGKPGCGKTLLGKVIAGQVSSTFIWVTAAQASSAEFIKEIFELAREIAPSVLFFEDIDMYTVDRSYGMFNPKVGELLAQMDGMVENNGLIVMATTNTIDVIEKALSERPSRFDRRYCLDNMNFDTTMEMVKLKLGNANLSNVTIPEIAEMVRGLNGCFIEEVVITAKRKAISRGLVNENGIVNLDKEIMQESADEVQVAFNLKGYGSPLDQLAWNKESGETEPVMMSLSKEPKEKLTFATAKTPSNVNLTQEEKKEIDGEVKAALAALVMADEEDGKHKLSDYVSDDRLDEFSVAITGAPFKEIEWRRVSKPNLRKMFRLLVLANSVRKSTGKGKALLADRAMLGDMLHAMDMLSDRYYWVHALIRLVKEFGIKTTLPFNPYKNQTSKEASLDTYDELMGKILSAKKREDKINKENGVFVPKEQKNNAPELSYNQPQKPENVTKPDQMEKVERVGV